MVRPLIVSVVLILAVFPPFVAAQDYCKKQFVVSQVNLQTTENRLATWQQAAVRAKLIGRCFDSEEPGEFRREVSVGLYNLGYLDETVSETAITVSDPSRVPESVSVDVKLDEGLRQKVREIDVIGNRVVPIEQIRSVYQIQLAGFLDMAKVQETADAIRRVYAANGYGKASVVPKIQRQGRVEVCVAFEVLEGPRSF